MLFLITYRVLTPGKGITLRNHVPGAAVFTVAWLALTALGGLIFAELIQQSTVLYGTIGGIFGFLAFLYATMWSLLIGAELSAVLMAGVRQHWLRPRHHSALTLRRAGGQLALR